MITLHIDGIPVPQGRPRARTFKIGNDCRVQMYDPPKSKEWKEYIRLKAEYSQMKKLEGAIKMDLVFWMPRAKSNKDKHHTKRPDVDNLAKAVKDALEGIAYKNDSQVVDLRVRKYYETEIHKPGVDVSMEPVELPF